LDVEVAEIRLISLFGQSADEARDCQEFPRMEVTQVKVRGDGGRGHALLKSGGTGAVALQISLFGGTVTLAWGLCKVMTSLLSAFFVRWPPPANSRNVSDSLYRVYQRIWVKTARSLLWIGHKKHVKSPEWFFYHHLFSIKSDRII
jgi:hypothetical protein